ncbi:MAG: hypothetical protein ACREIS_05625 [Nitrospiraceae bacterium]
MPLYSKSADGSIRCTACHLHPDTCSCRPTLPTIHSNGTSWRALLSEVIVAARAMRLAEDALREAWPNGRDYYPQGDQALQRVEGEWNDMQRRLVSVRLDLERFADGLHDLEPGK